MDCYTQVACCCCRYSDFQVNEVDSTGAVVHLTSLQWVRVPCWLSLCTLIPHSGPDQLMNATHVRFAG